MEAFYSDGVAQSNAQRAALASSSSFGPKLETLFDKYATAHPNSADKHAWTIDATLAWCEDLEVSPEDPVMLAVAELCKAQEMGSFTRKKWIDGWKLARCDTIEAQKSHLDTLRENFKTRASDFRRVYTFTFEYAKEDSQRTLALETALPMWELLLSNAPEEMFEEDSVWCGSRDKNLLDTWLGKWSTFLQAPDGGKNRPISKDVWAQVSHHRFH